MIAIGLGWGVQSWTLAAMSALGELPPVDVALHADTTHERQATYEFAERWTPWLEARGVHVVTVRDPNAAPIESVIKDIPAFTVGLSTGGGQLHRQCTERWKIDPKRQWLSAELKRRGLKKSAGVVEMWLGISLDEVERTRPSDVKYIVNAWPLLDLRMSRAACIVWLTQHALEVPPKSSCVFCPYQSLESWRALRREGGPDWDKAVAVDTAVRGAPRTTHAPFDLYVHPARRPLAEAADDGGQLLLPMMQDECFGVCGV